MGTSASSKGSGRDQPLVPPWADDEPGKPVPQAEPKRFQAFRRSFGKYLQTRDPRDLQRSLGHYARTATGGSAVGPRRFGSVYNTGGDLYSVLSSLGGDGTLADSRGLSQASLTGQPLDVGHPLRLANGRLREILAYSTIHAQLVAGADDEVVFAESVSACLADLGITASLICGRKNSLVDGDRCIHGFSLVIHDLKPEDSLHLLYAGLGSHRKYGCGIFVPYKVISDLY